MRTLPLAGKPLAAQSWPAATVAASLLRELGAEPDTRPPAAAVVFNGCVVDCPETSSDEDWAATGLAALTGRPSGPLLVPVGAPGTAARGLTLAIRALGGVADDGAALLGMRRDILPLSRGGTKSANGTARLLPTRDGWLAISLARSSDFELVPALVSGEASDPWSEIAMWASRVETASAVDRAATLGLAAAGLGEQMHARPWSITPWPNTSRPRRQERPVVVNLGALWAAPLAAHVLHRSGATVVDVRTGRGEDVNDRWRDRLHDGHQTEHVDLTSPDGRNHLRELVTEADVVIEASRPRALRQLGVDAESIMPDKRPRVWLRLTGYPRPAERIAYGDDAAVAGGLVAHDANGPVFVGDAIADPLTGLRAALAALACLSEGGSWVVDLAMSGVAAHAAGIPDSGHNQCKLK